jgi:hypothetical protein
MNSLRRWSLLAVAFLVLIGGCDRCRSGQDGLTRATDARVTSLSSALPASAQAVILIPDLAEMRETIDITLDRAAHIQPQIRMLEQQMAREVGIRITSEESWREAGINPDGSLMIAILDNRPVLATYIENRQAFESRFIERMRHFTRTESPVRNETVGGRAFKISGDVAGSDFAWFYQDDLVVLAMPPFDAFGVFEQGTATNILTRVAGVTSETSLARDEHFSRFRSGLGDHFPLSVYFNNTYLHRVRQDPGAQSNDLIQFLASFSHATNGAGIAARADADRVEVKAFFVADDEVVALANEAFHSDADTDWSGFLTTNTVFAARTSVDLAKIYEMHMERLPDDERRRIRRAMSQSGRAYQLDIEQDLIGAFSGHTQLTFYGLGGDLTRLMALLSGGSLSDTLRSLLANAGLVFNAHFADTEKQAALLSKLQEVGGDTLTRRPLIFEGNAVEDVEVFEPRMLNIIPARIFVRGDSLTVSAAAIGENAAYQYLTAQRQEGLLSKHDDFPLGKEFAEASHFNGLYLNVDRLRGQIRRIPMLSGVASQLQPFHELLLTVGTADQGVYARLVVDFSESLEQDEAQ